MNLIACLSPTKCQVYIKILRIVIISQNFAEKISLTVTRCFYLTIVQMIFVLNAFIKMTSFLYKQV